MPGASVEVAVRIRPFSSKETEQQESCCTKVDGKKVQLISSNAEGGLPKEFTYDYLYWSVRKEDEHYANQERVFQDIGTKVVQNAVEGFNSCVFAYGQTGSGKTHTMTGTDQDPGLIPRICRNLFTAVEKGNSDGITYRIELTYIEIFKEKIRDLLLVETRKGNKNSYWNKAPGEPPTLRVRGSGGAGLNVVNVTRKLVTKYSDVEAALLVGNSRRTTAATLMNSASSRSHAIVTITFCQATLGDGVPNETKSKLHLVDLAGSERGSKIGGAKDRMDESKHINKSLSVLSKVIRSLSKLATKSDSSTSGKRSILGANTTESASNKKHHVPYRDSMLTRLLEDSLGGNCKTFMIATISPALCNYNETLSTLRYASQAKFIRNTPTVNEDSNVKIIRQLRQQISELQALQQQQQQQRIQQVAEEVIDDGTKDDYEVKSPCRSMESNTATVDEDKLLLATLSEKQQQEQHLTQEWHERWRLTKDILKEQNTLALKKAGSGVMLESRGPHLVVLQDSSQMSAGLLLYHLKRGLSCTIGSDEHNDIMLQGDEMLPQHCTITLSGPTLPSCARLVPQQGALCLVGQELVTRETVLQHGCLLVLGMSHMFRYNNPDEVNQPAPSQHNNLSRLSFMSLSTSMLNISAALSDSSLARSQLDVSGTGWGTPDWMRSSTLGRRGSAAPRQRDGRAAAQRPVSCVLPASACDLFHNSDMKSPPCSPVVAPGDAGEALSIRNSSTADIPVNAIHFDQENDEDVIDENSFDEDGVDKSDSGLETCDGLSQKSDGVEGGERNKDLAGDGVLYENLDELEEYSDNDNDCSVVNEEQAPRDGGLSNSPTEDVDNRDTYVAGATSLGEDIRNTTAATDDTYYTALCEMSSEKEQSLTEPRDGGRSTDTKTSCASTHSGGVRDRTVNLVLREESRSREVKTANKFDMRSSTPIRGEYRKTVQHSTPIPRDGEPKLKQSVITNTTNTGHQQPGVAVHDSSSRKPRRKSLSALSVSLPVISICNEIVSKASNVKVSEEPIVVTDSIRNNVSKSRTAATQTSFSSTEGGIEEANSATALRTEDKSTGTEEQAKRLTVREGLELITFFFQKLAIAIKEESQQRQPESVPNNIPLVASEAAPHSLKPFPSVSQVSCCDEVETTHDPIMTSLSLCEVDAPSATSHHNNTDCPATSLLQLTGNQPLLSSSRLSAFPSTSMLSTSSTQGCGANDSVTTDESSALSVIQPEARRCASAGERTVMSTASRIPVPITARSSVPATVAASTVPAPLTASSVPATITASSVPASTNNVCSSVASAGSDALSSSVLSSVCCVSRCPGFTSEQDSLMSQASLNSLCSSINTSTTSINTSTTSTSNSGDYSATISRFMLRGSASDEHWLYQVDLRAGSERWSVLRRYSKFRELWLYLGKKYPELCSLDFPPRHMFHSASEVVGARRKKLLQSYLRAVLSVCSREAWSPLVGRQPSAATLARLSLFFKKGVFDETWHSTS